MRAWCLVPFAAVLACSSDTALFVEVQTDLLAGVEFDRTAVELRQGTDMAMTPLDTIDRPTRGGEPFARGVRVAELALPGPGTFTVTARLSLGGREVASRVARVDVSGTTGVTIVIARSCAGTTCPGPGDPPSAVSCAGGLCTDPRCVTGRESSCPAAECTEDAQCPPGGPCSRPVCAAGLCLRSPEDECPAGTVCHPIDGCVAVALDAGAPSDGCVAAPELCNDLDDDCDGTADEDFDLASDAEHCGSCGRSCAVPRAVGTCAGGKCTFMCDRDFADCNAIPGDGCESDLRSSGSCGRCGIVCGAGELCAPSGASYACTTDCPEGTDECGASCVDTDTDTAHCGECDRACAPSHATGACAGGVCRIGACHAGWGDCNGNPADGCEQPLTTLAHCGGCGVPCTRASASATCASGSCRILACDALRGNCDGMDSNGCESALDSLAHCGGCGMACALEHAVSSCSGASCRIVACTSGWRDCDSLVRNGCESPDTICGCGIECGARCCSAGSRCCPGGGCCPADHICCGDFCCPPDSSCCGPGMCCAA